MVATVGTADAGDALIPIAAEAEGGDGVNHEGKAEDDRKAKVAERHAKALDEGVSRK